MALSENTGTVRVGIVGPPDVVQRMIEIGHSLVVDDFMSMNLVGTSYNKQAQIPERVHGLVDDVDVVLFAGPLPYDIALEAGVLTRPATFVELAGSSLYGAMLRATRGDHFDLERVSIDSLSKAAVAEAYDECELTSKAVRILPYDGPDSASRFADFHRELFAAGRTSGALTTVETVARELTRAKVPVIRVRATISALRTSLRTAAFLGAGSLLEAAQVVIGLIEIPQLPRRTGHGAVGTWAAQELRLEVVKALRPETDRLSISLMPRDDHSLALVATLSAISDVTQDFTVAPFVSRVQRATGVTPLIGFGMGSTALAAELNAEQALADARSSSAGRAYVRLRDGSSLAMSSGPETVETGTELVESRLQDMVNALRDGLGDADSNAQLIDAESASGLLGISARTARRILQDLAREGLVWPVPASAVTPGRPRQTYRLVGTRS
jgi:hypothetical protein